MPEELGAIEPRIKLVCVGPPLEMPFYQIANPIKRAGTLNIQFNVNTPALPRTLFVNHENDAECRVVTDRVILAGRHTIIDLDVITPADLNVAFLPIGPDAPKFVVQVVPGVMRQGSATLRFEVDYQ
jgi:hypothetical protein